METVCIAVGGLRMNRAISLFEKTFYFSSSFTSLQIRDVLQICPLSVCSSPSVSGWWWSLQVNRKMYCHQVLQVCPLSTH